MSSKYIDPTSVIQVIGCVFNNPSLLDMKDKYTINEEDFIENIHKIIYGTIYKLHELGAKEITLNMVKDFLADRPKSDAVFKAEKGEEWLIKTVENSNELGFDYYYHRLKKFSLLRAYDNCGISVADIYDPDNIFDTKLKQKQEEILDNSTLEELADKIDKKIDEIRFKYVDDALGEAAQAAEGITELIDKFKQVPEVGIPMYGPFINTVTRGARLGKFYLRSAATGIGKTRTMIADACYFACDRIYDEVFGWIKNGTKEPTLFIATEQDLSEVQTMMLAFLSNVNEEHILNGKYEGDEEDRVREAAKILTEAPLYVEVVPDFSLQDIENCIKKNIREHGVKYVLNPRKRVLGQ